MSSPNSVQELQSGLNELSESIRWLQENGEMSALPDETVQQLFSLALKLYTSRLNDNPGLLPFPDERSVTPTEAVIAVTRILKQADVQVFELAMWQTMGSIR